MTNLHKAAREALEALEKYRDMMFMEAGCRWGKGDDVIATLRAALDEAPGEEREAFEAWAKNEGIYTDYWLGSPDHGYANSRTCDYWTGWQARAMLAARPSVPQGERHPSVKCIGRGARDGCGFVGGTSGDVCPSCGGMLLSDAAHQQAGELAAYWTRESKEGSGRAAEAHHGIGKEGGA